MSVNCTRCGTQFGSEEWFCSHCGQERPRCPDCGAEMDGDGCKNCNTVRQAPCEECGLLIDATSTACPHCDHDAEQAAKQQQRERKETQDRKFKRSLMGVGGGIAAFYVISGIVPGPDVIGAGLGLLVALPTMSIFGLMALNAKRKQRKDIDIAGQAAADIQKGRDQNKSRAWKEKKKQEREAALNVAAKGLDAVGNAAESWAEGENSESSSTISAGSSSSSAQTFDLDATTKIVERELNCPNCGQDWRIVKSGLRNKYRIDGATPMDELTAIESTRVQCEACNSTEYINSWG